MAEQSKVALVTGASKGIGRAIALRLVADGFQVAGTSRSGEAPDGVLGIACDVTDTAAVDAAFTQIEADLGPVTVVVANAGITKDTLLARMSDADWDAVVDTNLTGAFRVARRAARGMMKARYGRVVLVSSVVGLTGSPGQVNYAASKSGLIGLARSLGKELGARGVTANVVSPGFITTDMTGELSDERRAQYLAAIPAARMGEVDDVAAAVAFLASEQAGYINGAVLPVDGGLGMGH